MLRAGGQDDEGRASTSRPLYRYRWRRRNRRVAAERGFVTGIRCWSAPGTAARPFRLRRRPKRRRCRDRESLVGSADHRSKASRWCFATSPAHRSGEQCGAAYRGVAAQRQLCAKTAVLTHTSDTFGQSMLGGVKALWTSWVWTSSIIDVISYDRARPRPVGGDRQGQGAESRSVCPTPRQRRDPDRARNGQAGLVRWRSSGPG